MIPHDPDAELLRKLIRATTVGGTHEFEMGGIDWARFTRLVHAHQLPSFLEFAIRLEDAIPAEVRQAISDNARRLRIRSALLRMECARLIEILEREGCEPIVLKGVSLALSLYRDPGDRVFSDLDVWVPRERLEDACRAAARAGFVDPTRARAASNLYDRHHFHRVLESPAGIRLEMHWDLTRPGSPFRFDLRGFRERARLLDAEGGRWRVPSDVDQYLHAASQCVKEGFTDLRRVVDAALLLRAGAASVGAGIAGIAHRQALATAAWQLGELSGAILDSPIPEPSRSALRPSDFIVRCLRATDGPAQLLAAHRRRAGERQLVRWLCIPSRTQAVRAILRYVLPTEADLFDEVDPPEGALHGVRFVPAILRRGGSASWAVAILAGRLLLRDER